VTYVSRIPPPEPKPVEDVPKPEEDVRRPANVEANMGLIREIERIKRRMPPIPDESPLMRRGRAVDRLLFGDASGDGQGQSELEKIVSWWADIEDESPVKREIRQDLMTYLNEFYESDLVAPEQVLYTFEEGKGKTVHDVSDVGKPLNLIVKDEKAVSWVPGGLAINKPTLVATSGFATKLIEAAKASNEITIEAWVKPADDTRGGPARIVTLSKNIRERNFTLGQDGNRYDVRLRTTETDKNGNPSLKTPAGSLTTELSHVVYTRDSWGVARIYINGVERVSGTVGGDFDWDDDCRFGLANEFTSRDRTWLGELHLVAIYSRALKPDEVSQNFEAGLD
jgi:hypothetical protein